ncbi:DNA (cytosine-5-)-methyltransferase [Macrococcus armenti]|uniref:DNA (cytosine-5-)-methyltransferase n=1 Tax=Macrococcus armenti TaxID=2875764 RepID=UPI001CCDAC24|nr:DNA (cytosine-5-)-methyltransferase [Macrococcus armenti]UBH21894.1 DNA (cytosine-5-)-methyltransferase [Macrococcus armenti]
MRIDYEELTLPVVRRRHTVPKNDFVSYMRSSRQTSGLRLQDIADSIGVNKTEVEHWFRTDNCFSVPRPDVWNDVKRILSLDDRYDDVVTEFIEVEGVFEKAGRCYWTDGIAPTLTSAGAAELIFEQDINEKQTKEGDGLTNTQTQYNGEKKPFKYISLFAGIGGFDFGLDAVGGECVFASEIDKFASEAYRTLHNGDVLHGDITKIDAEDVPDHDVMAAGFPCQAFSVAGKRGGFEDARGTLFFEVARIASVKQPSVLLLENVKGLVGHDKGKTLDTIVKTLNDIGYRVDFDVLNSKYFGVPQNRERIFIVAVREDLVDNEEWNIVGTNVVAKGKKRISQYEGVKTFNFAYPDNDTVDLRLIDVLETSVDEKYYLSEEKSNFIFSRVKHEGRLGKSTPQIGDYRYDEGLRIRKDDNSPTLRANMKTMGSASLDMSNTIFAIEGVADRTRNGQKTLEPNGQEVANALTSVQHDSMAFEKPALRIRKLTPKECWRLQGFTDEQHDVVEAAGISNSQRYKQAGNAVTVNVIIALGERLLTYLP